jgi:alanyl-tRNA synthetase
MKMKIMMLSWEYPPRIVGGIARVVHDLSHAFASQGHEVHVITYQEGETKEFEKDGQVYSRELCGGTHVNASGQIGYFHIVSESALATGIRRIECITGNAAEAYVYNLQNKLQNIEALLKIDANNIENKIEQLIEDKKKLEQEIYNLKKNAISSKSSADNTEQVNGINFVGKILEGVNPKELKSFVDEILKNVGSAIVVLGAKNEGKASIVVGLSADLTSKYSAVDFVKQAAVIVGGNGGGGRPDMAQAGGTMPEKLPQAIESIKNSI